MPWSLSEGWVIINLHGVHSLRITPLSCITLEPCKHTTALYYTSHILRRSYMAGYEVVYGCWINKTLSGRIIACKYLELHYSQFILFIQIIRTLITIHEFIFLVVLYFSSLFYEFSYCELCITIYTPISPWKPPIIDLGNKCLVVTHCQY